MGFRLTRIEGVARYFPYVPIRARVLMKYRTDNMKKTLLAIAAIVVSAGAMAAPAQHISATTFVQAHDVQTIRMDHRRKVWVPAHREHGHFVRGHYVWR